MVSKAGRRVAVDLDGFCPADIASPSPMRGVSQSILSQFGDFVRSATYSVTVAFGAQVRPAFSSVGEPVSGGGERIEIWLRWAGGHRIGGISVPFPRLTGMSYRSVKKVLGETNLERKCRVLFGLSLLALISVSFWFYGKRTTQLIEEKNRDTGRRLVDSALLKYHWLKWRTDERERQEVADYSRSMENLDYEWHVIDFNPPPNPGDKIVAPEDAWEREHLPMLKALLQRSLDEYEVELQEHRAAVAQFEEAKERLST
jgi:hypothetical protein